MQSVPRMKASQSTHHARTREGKKPKSQVGERADTLQALQGAADVATSVGAQLVSTPTRKAPERRCVLGRTDGETCLATCPRSSLSLEPLGPHTGGTRRGDGRGNECDLSTTVRHSAAQRRERVGGLAPALLHTHTHTWGWGLADSMLRLHLVLRRRLSVAFSSP